MSQRYDLRGNLLRCGVADYPSYDEIRLLFRQGHQGFNDPLAIVATLYKNSIDYKRVHAGIDCLVNDRTHAYLEGHIELFNKHCIVECDLVIHQLNRHYDLRGVTLRNDDTGLWLKVNTIIFRNDGPPPPTKLTAYKNVLEFPQAIMPTKLAA